MSFVLIAVALTIVITTYEIWRRSRSPLGLPKVSFSWPTPILYLKHYFTSNNGKTMSNLINSYRAKYGDIFVMPLFGKDIVVFTGEEGVNWAAKQEKDDNFARELNYNSERLFATKRRDLASKKDVWKNFRATVSPALMQSSTINNFCPTMVQVIDKHLSQIDVIDADTLSAITFEIGWLFIVGKRGFDSRQQVHHLYKDFRMGLFSLPLDLPGTQLRKGMEAREKIAAIVNKIVEDDPTAKDDPDCSLHAIIDPTEEQTGARIMGFLFAATDTTSMTMSGLLWHLIENPAITKELQKEIRDNPDPQSLGDFQKFTYLNKVVQEALRLYGVDFVFRSAKTALQHKNIRFPPKTLFAITTGYDHSSVKNPQQFDPEREEKYKLEPFGTPSRNCLGKVFAQFQMKMILQRVLKNYNVVGEKDEGASVRQGSSIRLKNARLKLARPV